jgi:hypothetical protein
MGTHPNTHKYDKLCGIPNHISIGVLFDNIIIGLLFNK